VAAVGNALAVRTHPVDTYNNRLIFNGPRWQQGVPMGNSTVGPIGQITQDVVFRALIVRVPGIAGRFRKTQVVANGRHGLPTLPGETQGVVARYKMGIFPGQTKQVHFVCSLDLTVRKYGKKAVGKPKIGVGQANHQGSQ
jgi:hypothetical protein